MPALTGYSLPTINDLRNIPATTRVTSYARLVTETKSWYIFISTSTETPDQINIVSPLSGSGRWYKTQGLSIAADVLNLTEYIDDRIAALLQLSSTIEESYDDNGNTLSLDVRNNSIGDTKISSLSMNKVVNLTAALSAKADNLHTHSPLQISDLEEYIEDIIASFLSSGSNISLNYDDTSNLLVISGTPSPITIKDENNTIGTATIIKFTGTAVTATVNGNEVVVNVASPPDFELEVQEQNVIQGSVKSVNFTGSGINSITVTGDTATIDISGGSSNSSAITEINYTIQTVSPVTFNSFSILTWTPEVALLLRALTSNFPCRVRVYSNTTYANNDLGRPVDTELSGEHGCLLEVVTTPTNLTVDLAPPVMLYRLNNNTPLSIIIDNLDTTSRNFTLTLSSLKW